MKGATILPLRLDSVCYDAAGKRLLDSISTALTAGPRTLILGPNGAGKSLLLRICHGLLQPSAGRVEWQGPAATAARRRQAMVFQRPVMLRRSAAANIDYALKLRRLPRGDRAERVAQALERTGLTALAHQPARALSGGEQQRLALARAWATRPEVLFLDEPTASLDPAATRAVEEIVDAIHRAGTKIVMTTHDLGQARRLGDEVLFLHQGRLIEQDSAKRFFAGPRSEPAAAFVEGRLLW
ncbi:ATP-binding cassette domain-containing protein [Rhodospirillaceae bacterium SYSU D60014]|uniref:ATP-binding cassette domain-containing protein n=1 Tax=Virgifigura deserti TaxID=2268457 RepID=UPI000E66A50B